MRKLLFTLACLCVLASATRAQDPTYPTSYSRGGNITTSSANCDPTACIGIGLPTPSASVITVGLTGTWSGTLSPEQSQDGGRTFTSAGAGLTSNGTTSYVIAGFTSFRIRAGTLASGNAGVNLTVSNAPTGSVTSGTTDPTGNACSANALYVQTTTGNLYSCDAGVFAKVGPSSGTGTVTNIATTGPISGGPITTTGTISCPTCTTSAAAITNNVLAKGSGGAQGLANSSVTDNGTTVSSAELVNFSGTGAASNSPFLLNGTVFTGGSGTTTFPYAYLNFGTAPTSFSTSGTLFGLNAPTGFGGNFIDFHLNGGASIWRVTNTGALFSSSTASFTTLTAGNYATSTNCSASGTAANPSVVTCAAASSGAFACSPSATGGTCQVNTTAVTTNSDIQITPTDSASTRLSVTCNTTADTPTAPRIAAVSTGASFTINLGTVTANPTCYFYTITN